MTNRRAKIAAGATVIGLGALGGVALGTNPGMPNASQPVASTSGSSSVVTSASGAVAVPATQNAALHQTRPPIVTRASGGVGATNLEQED
ncbi:MAG TPA: hypothetical protein VLC07_00545 [Solirubrobacterales bacterium]|nr:hypothetical protein [Solirubrobacterales bacterium]